MRISVFRIAIAAFVITRAANGCSCGPLPICEWRTPETAVFVGKVIQGGADPADRGKWPSHFNEVTLEVIEPFHGIRQNQSQFKLQTMFAKGMCGQTPYFQGATVLVVVARQGSLGWADGGCTSRSIEHAAWELETLRQWNRAGNKGILVGRADPYQRFDVKSQPDGKTTPVSADSTGRFRVRLNPGKYLVPNDPEPVVISRDACVGSTR